MKAKPSTKPGAITSLGNTFSKDFMAGLPYGFKSFGFEHGAPAL
jgi:hypothetical protein